MKKRKLWIAWMMVCLLTGCGSGAAPSYVFSSEESRLETQAAIPSGTETATPVSELLVYVCGQVRNPDVYTLPVGSRVCDALQAAGGMTEEADREYLNLAEVLEDGARIYFPTEQEAAELARAQTLEDDRQTTGISSAGRVNLNRADAQELMTLSGIGQTRANAIITYRDEHGDFQNAEDVMKVSGIGNAVFSKIRDDITVN